MPSSMVALTNPAPLIESPRGMRPRVALVDALRGFALFGIFLVNLGGFSLYGAAPPEMRAAMPTAATDCSVGFVTLWLDRTLLIWAAVLLVSHLIMTTLRILSNGALDPGAPLVRAAIWFATSVLGLSPDAYFKTFAEGGWLDVLKGNLAGPLFRYSFLLTSSRFQRVPGMFLLGLWVGRRGILADPAGHHTLLRRVIIWGLPVGLVANTVVAWVELDQPPSGAIAIGETAAYVVGVVPLAMAYVPGFSLLWLQPAWQPRLASFAPAGRMALTCYLTQTFIGCALFYGIGLGWAGRVGPTYFPLIALVVFAVQVVCCRWWLRRFRFGPVEWLWRSLTYGTMQRMSPASRASAAASKGITATSGNR